MENCLLSFVTAGVVEAFVDGPGWEYTEKRNLLASDPTLLNGSTMDEPQESLADRAAGDEDSPWSPAPAATSIRAAR